MHCDFFNRAFYDRIAFFFLLLCVGTYPTCQVKCFLSSANVSYIFYDLCLVVHSADIYCVPLLGQEHYVKC